jgi:hypothetical protein
MRFAFLKIFSPNVLAHPRGEEDPENQTECFPASDGASCSLLDVLPLAVWAEYPAYGWAISTSALALLIKQFFKTPDEQLREAIEAARAAGNLELDGEGVIQWVWPSQASSSQTIGQKPSTP